MSEDVQGAYLVVCPECGKHAAIVYADGDQSENFKTKVDGKVLLLMAHNDGFVNDEELVRVEREIDNSTLSFNEEFEEMPESVRNIREDLQRRRLFGGSIRGFS